jgi:phosphoribosylanthranilate isomerase
MLDIKICGCTTIQNTLDICQLPHVTAIGLNFYQPSKRSVLTQQAKRMSKALREYAPDTKIVGLFVNHSFKEITKILKQVDVDILQFHGDEPAEVLQSFVVDYEIWKSVSLGNISDLELLKEKPPYIDRWLIDAKVPGAYGGTGMRIDKDLVRQALQIDPTIILAGGITPENITDTVSGLSLTMIDIASGAESEPGVKDVEKVKKLFKEQCIEEYSSKVAI